MKRCYKLCVILLVFICVVGCSFKKINQADFKLTEVFEGFHWVKEESSYVLTDVSGAKYKFYFDSKDYHDNYFSIFVSEQEIKYYYVEGMLEDGSCNVKLLEFENGTISCDEENIKHYNHLILSFQAMTDVLKVEKEDLFITDSELGDKYIHVDE